MSRAFALSGILRREGVCQAAVGGLEAALADEVPWQADLASSISVDEGHGPALRRPA